MASLILVKQIASFNKTEKPVSKSHMNTTTLNSSTTTENKTGFAFILITTLFFLWGFAHNLDPILIPHLKKSFTLSTTQSTLVDSAVFIAYFLMALPAGFIMKRFGYKIGIIIGLSFFATGAFMKPAENAVGI